MTKAQLKTHARLYRELDILAAHAFVIGDTRNEGRYLDARAEIGRVILEADYAFWKALHDARSHTTSCTTPRPLAPGPSPLLT